SGTMKSQTAPTDSNTLSAAAAVPQRKAVTRTARNATRKGMPPNGTAAKSGASAKRASVAAMVMATATAKASGDPGRNGGRLRRAISITGGVQSATTRASDRPGLREQRAELLRKEMGGPLIR